MTDRPPRPVRVSELSRLSDIGERRAGAIFTHDPFPEECAVIRQNQGDPSRRSMWAYGYEINPSLARDRLSTIESLLDEEHSNERPGGRTWKGRLVVEEQVTHILVVSDSPDQDLEVNHRLEAELQRMEAAFSVTAPLMIADGA